MLNKNEVGILIPVYNEEKNISQVIDGFKKYGTVFIINDNSTDNTQILCKKKKVYLIKNKNRIGYDRSLRKGIKHIIKYKKKIKILITADGDGQHYSKYVKKILNYTSKYDLIIGSRDFYNRVSENIVNFFSKILFKIEDPLSGMKSYNLKKVKYNKAIFDSKNDFCGMFFFKMFELKNILCIKIKTKPENKSSSFGHGLLANFKILKSFLISVI